MKNVEQKLVEGFNVIELEQRLEMVNLTVLTGEAAADSFICDVGSVSVSVSAVEVAAPAQ